MIGSAILCSLVFLIWVYLVIGVAHEGDRFRLPLGAPPAHPKKGRPGVSVIIPARNEAHQIAGCIESLRQQSFSPEEIIVVDDCSTDGTRAVIEGLPEGGVAVKIVRGSEPPKGWLGKSHAIVQGLAHAEGAWLLFTDADTIHAPATLASALAWAERNEAALLSITGDQRAGSPWEKIVQPLVFRLLDALYPLAGANGTNAARAAANGIYMLVRRDAYEAIGTHESFRDVVLEDVAMARAFRKAGHRTAFLRGEDLLQVRMYRSFREIWEGWTKNFSHLLNGNVRHARLVAAVVLCAGLLPAVMVWYGGAAGWLAAGIAVGGEAWFRSRRNAGTLWALTLPIGAIIVAAMIGESVRRHSEGEEFTWKGRRYPS